VAHRNHGGPKVKQSVLTIQKKSRRSLENKVMIETMHTCMHIVPVLYHSYYTTINISLTKHIDGVCVKLKIPRYFTSININYVVGLARCFLLYPWPWPLFNSYRDRLSYSFVGYSVYSDGPVETISLGVRLKPTNRFGLFDHCEFRFLEISNRSVLPGIQNRRVWFRLNRFGFSAQPKKPKLA
jgi:hypothetical protein